VVCGPHYVSENTYGCFSVLVAVTRVSWLDRLALTGALGKAEQNGAG